MTIPFGAVARASLPLEGFAVLGEAADALSALVAVGRLGPMRVADGPARGFIPQERPIGAAGRRAGRLKMRLLGVAAAGLALAIAAEPVTYLPEGPRLAAPDETADLPRSQYWIVSPAGRRWSAGSCDSRCSGSRSSSSRSMSAA